MTYAWRGLWLAFAAALLMAIAAQPAAAKGDLIVALGDSFSSGEGAPEFERDANGRVHRCHRSANAWPALLAQRKNADFVSFACSGARTADVVSRGPQDLPSQIGRLAELDSVDLVTVTVGGNDLGFKRVLINCGAAIARCDRRYDDGPNDLSEAIGELEPRLRSVYRRVRDAAPSADLLVLGYPRLFPRRPTGTVCLGYSVDEVLFLNARIAETSRAIRRAAGSVGARFGQVQNAFTGQEVDCRKHPRKLEVNRPSGRFPVSSWFHPNAAGYRELTDLAAPLWP